MTKRIEWINEKRKLRELVPWDQNPRQITEEQAERLVDSLDEFGQVQTLAVDSEGMLIDGHQRKLVWAAAEKFGPDYEVDVRVASRQLSERERQKLSVYLHRGAHGDWDWTALSSWGLEEELLDWGFTEDELQFTLEEEPPEDPGPRVDKATELQEKWGVKTGDLWSLDSGNGHPHRLICGDCTDEAVVERVMDGERAQLCLTDPPYATGGRSDDYDVSREELQELIASFLPATRELCDVVLLTPGNKYQFDYPRPTWVLAWFVDAGVGVNPWGFTFWNAVFAYGNDPYLENGLGSRPDAVVITEAADRVDHPTSKPVKVWQWFVERGSVSADDLVYDPFAGSGTTGVACQNLGRQARMVEISEAYCAVILDRWSEMTGAEPELIE